MMMELEGAENFTNYGNFGYFINFMNMTEEEIMAVLKNHFPNKTFYRLFYPVYPVSPATVKTEVCTDDPDKYCDGSLKSIALAYKNIHG